MRGGPQAAKFFLFLAASFYTASATGFAAQPPQSENLKAADAAFRAGTAAYQRNDLREAHAQFAIAVRLVPNVAAAHTAFGTVLLAENRPKEAASELERAHKLDPADNNATLNLALAYAQLGDYTAAIPLFEAADRTHLQLTPEQVIAYASALAATSQVPVAQARIEQALTTSPDSAVLYDGLGTLLAQQERFAEAST